MEKTNAIRLIDKKGVDYELRSYEGSGAVAGADVACFLGEDPDAVFKTLVTVGASRRYHVFMVPVSATLDLKKAAKAVGEKKIEMIKDRELLPLTGYIHGGCSPVGMKKQFNTVVDSTAMLHGRIFFSAGRIGCQIGMAPSDLEKVIPLDYADVI